MRTLLRTLETHERYNQADLTGPCFICKAGLQRQYQYWHMVDNEFPYDEIAQEHRLLVPKRHIGTREELTPEERGELEIIKKEFDTLARFDAIFENFKVGRTFLPHYHLHLLKWKRV